MIGRVHRRAQCFEGNHLEVVSGFGSEKYQHSTSEMMSMMMMMVIMMVMMMIVMMMTVTGVEVYFKPKMAAKE